MSPHVPGRARLTAWLTAALPLALVTACSSNVDRIADPGLAPKSAHADIGVASVSGVVISQIYGGGGNANATYQNDFVELYNAGSAAVTIAGWSVQYGSATGTGNFAANGVTELNGTIAPGQYYLVKLAGGTTGTPLPTPDATGTSNLSASAGKVVLVNTSTGLACNGASTPCSNAQLAQIVDLVGYGNANFSEGTAATGPSGNASALFRKSNGAQDTNNNSADFQTGTPNPRNSGNAPATVTVTVAPTTASVAVGATQQFTATVTSSGSPITPTSLTWSTNPTGIATISSTGLATGSQAGTTTVIATAVVDGTSYTGTASLTVTAANTSTINWIDVSSSATSFPPGFQTQLFATARTASGGPVVDATFVFEALDPTIATIENKNNTGIITGVSASATKPRFRITATPIGGGTPYSFMTSPVTIDTPVEAPASTYANNAEFGLPTPATPSSANDMLIARNQYTLSYNQSRGTPNWVSYELDSRHMVAGNDRCNCFSADPLLPVARQIFTSDYTNGGFDRGHLTRSFDRTVANVDNATTFYLTNIVPQYADLNQGVWASFENALGDSATAGRAVYIVTGPIYAASTPLTFIKNEGKIAIPDSTWKVAIIGPKPGGAPFKLSDVQTLADLSKVTVIAVNMPNVTGIRNVPFSTYLTTVDKIEASTGYDILSALPANLQQIVESAPASVKALSMDVTPGQISLATTTSLSVVLYSTATFDASAVNPANVRLVTSNGTPVAPITRGTAVNTSVADVNGDGRPDRLVGFSVSALRAAGFSTSASSLALVPLGSTTWYAFDVTPPSVVP